MSMITALVLVAMLATVGSLIAGVSSMVTDSEVGHHTSAEWMGMRVAFQAAALLMILIALIS